MTRKQLNNRLKTILGSEVMICFQPPESVQLHYPCLVYSFSGVITRNGNNKKYIFNNRYSLTYIGSNPDNDEIIKKLLNGFEHISFDRRFVANNMYYDVFDLYT